MVITAKIDRIEDGNAILLSEEMGIEITIPVDNIEGTYKEGEIISLTLKMDSINKSLKEV